MTSLASRMSSVESQVRTVTSNVTSLTPRMSAIESKVQTVQSQTTSLSLRSDSLESQVLVASFNVTSLESDISAVQLNVSTVESQIAALQGDGHFVRRCRLCFREIEGSSQCQRSRNTCTGWSNAPSWSSPFRDDTDRRSGGCTYQWRLECA